MGEHAEHGHLVKAALALGLVLAAGRAQACGLALALAVDVSGSVDAAEHRLQMDGLAAALADGQVAEALVAQAAAVSVIQWAGAGQQAVTVPWVRLQEPAQVAALARAVATAPRPWMRSSTGIGAAMLFTAARLAEVPDCRRRVVDVSGDGRSNEGPAPRAAGRALAAAGITVNGLAITGSEPFLAEYYRDHVIAGRGAFVMTAQGYADYPPSIRRKLIAEVVPPFAAAPDARRAEALR